MTKVAAVCSHPQPALQISTEDFRVMTESFGMQLDDDSLLAVFAKVSTVS